MATITEITNLNQFMLSFPVGEREGLTIDALYERWRELAFRTEDLLAVKASLRDFENGARGRPIAEFLTEFDTQRCHNSSDKTK